MTVRPFSYGARFVGRGAAWASLVFASAGLAFADPPPVLKEIWPTKLYACGTRVLALFAEDLQCPPSIQLVKLGQLPIEATNVNFKGDWPNGQLQCEVQIDEGTAGGLWSVVLTNPDNQSDRLINALEIVSNCPKGRPGDLYVANQFGRNGVEVWYPSGPCCCPDENRQHVLGNVLQFDGVTGELICNFAFGGGEDDIDWLARPMDLTWSPNGNLFVCDERHIDDIGNVAGGGKVIEFDGRTGEYVRTFVPVGTGEDPPRFTSLAFGGPKGNLFALSRWTSVDAVFEYDGETGEFVRIAFRPLTDFGLESYHLKFGPNGNMLLSAASLGPTRRSFVEMGLNPDTGEWELVREIVVDDDLHTRVGFILEPPGEGWLITQDTDEVHRVDYETGDILATVIDQDDPPWKPGEMSDPQDLAYGPTGTLFVTGRETWSPFSPDRREPPFGAIHVYDTTTIPFEQITLLSAPHKSPIEGEVYLPRYLEFRPLPGDYGRDQAGGDWKVDLKDFARMHNAFTGPGVVSADVEALIAFDQDRDGDIDFADFGAFQRNFATTYEDYQ